MAVLSCPKCGHQVSNKAEKCPGCGKLVKEFLIFDQSYQQAVHILKDYSSTAENVNQAKTIFIQLGDYKDSASYIEKCNNKIKDLTYRSAVSYENEANADFEKAFSQSSSDCLKKAIEEFKNAEKLFSQLGDYRDSVKQAQHCKSKLQECESKTKEVANNETTKKAAIQKDRKIAAIIAVGAVVVCILIGIFNTVMIPLIKYNNAIHLLENGQYDEAITVFTDLGEYKDATDKVVQAENAKREYQKELKYIEANQLLNDEQYDIAAFLFEELGDYKDSDDKKSESKYLEATKFLDDENYDMASFLFEELGGYKDSYDKKFESKYLGATKQATKLLNDENYVEAAAIFKELGRYKNSETFDEFLKKHISSDKYNKYKEDFRKYEGLYLDNENTSTVIFPNSYYYYIIRIDEENWTFSIDHILGSSKLNKNATGSYTKTLIYNFKLGYTDYMYGEGTKSYWYYGIDGNKGKLMVMDAISYDVDTAYKQ